MKKIAVLDYASGQLRIFEIKEDYDSEAIEEIIQNDYDYRLKDVEWMEIKSICIEDILV